MRKYLSLTKALLKSGLGMNDGKNKKWFKIFTGIVLVLAFLPILGLLYMIIDTMLPLYTRIDQAATLMGVMLFLTCFVIFLFSLFMIPSIFYFSKDLEILLGLPLSGETILAAKFTVCTIYEYLFSCGVLIPTYVAFLHVQGMSISFLILGILVILLIPLFPLVLSTLLTMLLMRFVPYFKNRDRFNLVSSVLLIILGISFSFYMNTLDPMEEAEMIELLFSGNNSLLHVFMKLFPIIPYFARAIVNGSLPDFLIGLGICLLAIGILLTLGKMMYFKGAIGSSETSSSRKMMNNKQIDKVSHQGNKTLAYVKKDMKILFRTPAFFTNCLCTAILIPLLLLVLPFMNTADMEGVDFTALILYLEEMDQFPAYIIFLALGVGLLLGTVNLISATALSREGSQYFIMKYLPMAYREQIQAKVLCGIIVGIFTNLMMTVIMAIIFPLPWHTFLLYFGCTIIPTILGNELCIIVDLAKPKLIWEQEATAVKQNLGAFMSIMIHMALCIVIIASAFFLPSDMLMIFAILALVICIMITWIIYILAGKFAERAMNKL